MLSGSATSRLVQLLGRRLRSHPGSLTGSSLQALSDLRRGEWLRSGLEVGSELGETTWEAVPFEADAFDGASQHGCLGW